MRETGMRARWPRWPVTLALVSAIVAGGAAAVAKWPHAWWWLVVILAAATAVVPPALAAVSPSLLRRQEIGRVARAGLQGTTGADGRKLPTVRAANLETRVHQSVLAIPYIHRDVEDAIRAFLHARHPVLLIGSSMVGKTSLAAGVIADEFSSWPVAIPDSKSALADLDAEDVTLQGSVIWLDDIDRLIGPGGITDGALRRLSKAGNVIIGTIRARAYDQLLPSDQLRRPEWDVLNLFKPVFISRDLTQREQEQLARAISDSDILDRIRIVGLGEYVGAAKQVAEALKLGAAGTDPLGYALILGAADWRRCGMTRPVPYSLLASLAEPYLDQRNRARLADQGAFNMGLAWATRDINPNVALLQTTATDSYSIYDYALDLISAQIKPIPESSWAVIMADAEAPELLSIGYTAEVTYNLHEIAAQAFRQAVDSGHNGIAPQAAFNLGMILADEGDVQGAKGAYQKAIDSGHPDVAPRAAFNLGVLLAGEGDVQGAKGAYQKAIDSGHGVFALLAFIAGMPLQYKRKILISDAYQKAIDSGHADLAPQAAFELGKLLKHRGDVEGAKDAYQKAIDSGHADLAPRAAYFLALLLEKEGDVEGAKDAYQKAIDSGHVAWAPLAHMMMKRELT